MIPVAAANHTVKARFYLRTHCSLSPCVWCLLIVVVAKSALNTHFTFDLFVCVAVLSHHKQLFMACTDVAGIYQVTNQCVAIHVVDVWSSVVGVSEAL